MWKKYFWAILSGLVFVFTVQGLANALSVELISNGDFETGTFNGWTVTDQSGGDGSWYIDDNDGSTPYSSQSTVGPATGNYYAVTDQQAPGTHVLEQPFTVPIGTTSLIVSFDMFINDWSDQGPIDQGLDYTVTPNQHARVDIMSVLADPFSTSPSDIIITLVAPTVDSGPDPNNYTHYAFDVSGVLIPGTTYKLRFAEVDNQFFLNMGIDNVSIIANVNPVPEPGTMFLLGTGLVAFAGFGRKRYKK